MSCTKIQTLPHLRLPIISVWGERKEGRKGWNQQDNRRMTKKNFCPEERAALSGRAWPRPRIFIAGIYHGILRNIQHHISLSPSLLRWPRELSSPSSVRVRPPYKLGCPASPPRDFLRPKSLSALIRDRGGGGSKIREMEISCLDSPARLYIFS